MTTLSEEMQALPSESLVTIKPLGGYGEAANESGIPQTVMAKYFPRPFPKQEERQQDEQ